MTSPTPNPAAFPHSGAVLVDRYDRGMDKRIVASECGMTLRDYFAAKAMASFIVGMSMPAGAEWSQNDADKQQADRDYRDLARSAFDVADAMLKARAQ